MEENTFQLSEIIKIEQMPKIFSQLEKVGEIIDKELEGIDEIACTEENKQDVKKRKTEINNTIKALETRRIDIKKKLLEPYDMFEEKYNKECKEKLQEASDKLSNKINEIENQQREKKKKSLIEFFEQYQTYYHLENIVSFEQLKLNITLSASEKSLKESILNQMKDIATDVNLIIQEEYSKEIMLEYKENGFNYSTAKLTILNRHKALEELSNKEQTNEETRNEEQKNIDNVETLLSAPKEIEKTYECKFTIRATKNQLKLLKAFLESEGIEYND